MKTELPIDSLKILVDDLENAPTLYRPTQFWRSALERLVNELKAEGVSKFRSLKGPLSFFVPTYSFPEYHSDNGKLLPLKNAMSHLDLADPRCSMHLERLLSGEAQAESDYRVLLASNGPGKPHLDTFSESTVGSPIEQFEFDGRRFSRSSLNYLLGLAFLKQHCDLEEVNTVMEIGGGFGTLGEILSQDSRHEYLYIDVDIPPTIHCANYYLASVLGPGVVLGYAETRGMDRLEIASLAKDYRAATLPSWQLPMLQGKIDLFVNFISFQEMEPDVVRNYLSEVARLEARFILLRNISEGKAKAVDENSLGVRDPILGEMYDGFLRNYKLIATNTVPFGYQTVDGFHSQLRLYERH